MPKRKTVSVNVPVVRKKIKSAYRSNVVFCEKMGRSSQKTWVTEWGRNHNLPSPEEAARMCVLLQTTPEEILSEEADIELVRSLIEQERENGIKKDPVPKDEVVGSAKQKLLDALDGLSDSQVEKLIGIIEEAKKLL